MKDIYLVIYTHNSTGHSFVASAFVDKKRAEYRVSNDNRDSSYEQNPGPACLLGYSASIFTVRLDTYEEKEKA